ncbi:MAG: biotin--[acetyl-CoA-carboxylase] ligase, partial [Acidimicrobiales bacterium]
AGTVAVAAHQSAGRGRRGRRWEAPPGRCLLASVLLRPVAPLGSLYAVTAAVALAAADACEDVSGVVAGVKWPNDLVVGDRKLAGILAEADAAAPGGTEGSVAVVVGIGCNVSWDDAPGATCLAAHWDREVAPDALLTAFLEQLAPRVARLDSQDGRRETVAELRRRCVTVGRDVRVEREGLAALDGLATGLDDDGHLLVLDATGAVRTIAVGDVVHLRSPQG